MTLEELQHKAKTDHMFLSTQVLGYDFVEKPHAELFAEYLKKEPGKQLFDLDAEIKKRMILWPRGCFKTSSVEVEIVQLILNYPDIRICILSGSEKLAENILKAAKSWFEKPTEKFQSLFPEFCTKKHGERLGTFEEFTVPNRKRTHLREPTVSISTARSVKAGAHFDVIFVDDLVNDQNYRKVEAQQNCFEDFKHVGPLLDPGGYLIVTGTMYTSAQCPENTYVWIQRLAVEEMKEQGRSFWRFSVKPCWKETCKTCGHFDIEHDKDKNYTRPPCARCDCKCFLPTGQKEILFPKVKTRDGRSIGHTIEFLESERKEKGEEFFVTQYENRLIPSIKPVYTPELIARQTLYHLNQLPAIAPTVIMGDLSYFGDTKRDETAFLVAKIKNGQIYVVDSAAGNWDTETITVEMFKLMGKHRPRVIFIEKTPAWQSFDYAFKAYSTIHKLTQLPIEWMKMNMQGGAKVMRKGMPQGLLAQGRLWMFAGMPHYDKLVAQMRRHPREGKTDDLLDCLGLLVEAPTGYHFSAMIQEKSTLPDYIRGMEFKPDEIPDPLDHSPLGAGLVG